MLPVIPCGCWRCSMQVSLERDSSSWSHLGSSVIPWESEARRFTGPPMTQPQSVQVQPALSSYALYSFGFLCTGKRYLLICRKQSSCVPPSMSPAWAAISRCLLEGTECTVCTVALSLLLCSVSLYCWVYWSNNPSIWNWSRLNVAFPFNYLTKIWWANILHWLERCWIFARYTLIAGCALAFYTEPGSSWTSLPCSACAGCTKKKATSTYCLWW